MDIQPCKGALQQFSCAIISAVMLLIAINAHAGYMSPVSVEGRDWLQPRDFVDTSWNEVASVCDPVTGTCSGNLNGDSLDGWTWASLLDVTYLFNSFLSAGNQLTPPGSIRERYLGAATEFILAGFIPTEYYYEPRTADRYAAVNGLTRTSIQAGAYSGNWIDGDSIYVWDHIRVGVGTSGKETGFVDTGHFFFRGPAFPVPEPASEALIAAALACLIRIRSR